MNGRRVAAIVLGLVVSAAPAWAQSGPLTESLRNTEPADYAFRLGSFVFSPSIAINELGVDSNVFDEADDPKSDFTVAMRPNVDVFANMGLFRFAGAAASEFTYFKDYESERSVARQYRGRLEGTFSLIRPFVAAAYNHIHTRPSDEIDARASREEIEMTVGVAADVSPIARVFVMGTRITTDYDDSEIFRDVPLADALNRDESTIAAGIRLEATPFTTVTFSAGYSEDTFDFASRNATSRGGKVDVEFSPEAVIRGKLALGFEDHRPDDSAAPSYRGLVGQAGLTYSMLERATLGVDFNRAIQYSYDASEAHFVQTGTHVTWTQRISGAYDAQVRLSREWLDYAVSSSNPVVNGYQIGVGYNLRDTSRISVNFEYAERVVEESPDRRYDRRRIFTSYTYGFRR
jgi:hypothetical protein